MWSGTSIARSYNNIGMVLKTLGQTARALGFFQKSLKIILPLLGPEHPDVRAIQNNVSSTSPLLLSPQISPRPRSIKTDATLFPCLQNTNQCLIYDLPLGRLIPEVDEKQVAKIKTLQEHSFLSTIRRLSTSNLTANKTDAKYLASLLKSLAEQETFVFLGLFHEALIPIYQNLDVSLAKTILHNPDNQQIKTVLQKRGDDEKISSLYFPVKELSLFINSIFKNFYDYLFDDYVKKKSEIYLSFLRSIQDPLAFEEISPAFQELQKAIHFWLMKKYDLKPSLWSPTQPVDDLLKTLRDAGPLVVVGQFGENFYNEPSIELTNRFSKKIQGWKPGTKRVITPKSHAVILVGVVQDNLASGGGYVYFVDPHNWDDTGDPQNNTFYKISYHNLQTHIQRFELFPTYAVQHRWKI